MTNELQAAIEKLLGPKLSRKVPDVGEANQLLEIADTALSEDKPCLYDYLTEKGPLLSIAQGMAASGWPGPAHALLYLYYDQIIKQEQASGQRIHKGPALCDLAILHDFIDVRASCHHYAALAVVADILWEPRDNALRNGGLALSMLLQQEQRSDVQQWREDLRRQFNIIDVKKPVFAEAGLAARWFSGRVQPIYDLCVVPPSGNVHFVDVLIDQVANKPPSGSEGVFFEAAVGLLLSATPGFEVRRAFKEPDEQVDLLV